MKSRLILLLLAFTTAALAESKPLRALLITGGCCHDYNTQKDLLKKGLQERLNILVDQVHADVNTPDGLIDNSKTKPKLSIYGNPDYAKDYDLVIHDECAAGIGDQAVVEAVLAPHIKGIPGVNLHCAMHSYRIGKPSEPAESGTPHGLWFEYLGLQSSSHGPQLPISIDFTEPSDPLLKGLSNWTTINEELYNNVKLFDSARPLAIGKQTVPRKNPKEGEPTTDDVKAVVVWTNLYKQNTRVFNTTIGHNNATVEDARYLELLSRGILWATNNLQPDGTPKPGTTK